MIRDSRIRDLPVPSFGREDLRMAGVIARREIRDSLRDWRIIVPIFLLTLGFPILMNFTVQRMLSFAAEFDSQIVAERLIPLLLMIVGFFPTSFCLVIALESFIGERERNSLEPLLATPLTNAQLYLGKMLSSVLIPLLASYLGVVVYVVSLIVRFDWWPPAGLLAQVLLLTTIQAIIMVAAAVIVSSQTTSVRAANLLASFIIVPMTLLIQGEAAALFWGNLAGLWWLILALALTAVVLVRMGVQIFNREELLGRDIDAIRPRWIVRRFWQPLTGRTADGRYPSIRRWYGETAALIPRLRQPALILAIALAGGLLLGALLAQQYPLPQQFYDAIALDSDQRNLALLQLLASELPLRIFVHNVRTLVLAALLGMFSLGVLGVLVFALPWALLGFLAGQLAQGGQNPVVFLLATVAPHGIIEVPALLLAAAAALRWHTVLIAPPPDKTVGESWLAAAAEFARILVGFVVPLLLLAAFVEAYVTPLVLAWVYGR